MKKKEFLFYTTTTIIMLLFTVFVGLTNEKGNFVKSSKAENDYEIVLNSANTPGSLSESSVLPLLNATPSRYVAWEYTNSKKSSDAHVLLEGDATNFGALRNIEPIQGIKGVEVTVGNSANVELLGSYTLNGAYESLYIFQTGNTSYPVPVIQPYLKLQSLVNTESAIINEVVVDYSCETHEETTNYFLQQFKAVGDFEAGNAWTMSGTTGLVSVAEEGAYFNSKALLINGWSGAETTAADLVMEYNVGILAAGSYTFVIGANLTHANLNIYYNDTLIGALSNEYESGGGIALVEGVNAGAALYNGKTLDWSWMRATLPFTVLANEEATIRLELATDDYFVDTEKTTWGKIDGIEIISGSSYLEPVFVKIPDAAISTSETLTTSSVRFVRR